MRGERVTEEEVARAADALQARGVTPSNEAVLREIGRGSATTIHRYLKAWQALHRPARAETPALPAALQRLMLDYVQQREAAARVELQAQLDAATAEAESMARENERLLEENDALHAERLTLVAERDRLRGQVAQLTADAAERQALLVAAHESTETARIELAQARLEAQSQTHLADSLRNERNHLREGLEREQTARIDAERRLAAAEAARQTLGARTDELLERATSRERECEQLRQLLDQARAAHGKTESELAAARAAAESTAIRVQDLQDRITDLRTTNQEMDQALRAALTRPSTIIPSNTATTTKER